MEQQSQPANQSTETTLPAGQPAATPPPNTSASPTVPQSENLLDEVYDESMEGYDKPVQRARLVLYSIGAMQLIGLFTMGDLYGIELYLTAGVFIFFALAFAGLAFWTKSKPFTAVLTGLIIYGGLLLLSAIVEPETIIRGIFMKIVAISLLISGLKNAKEVQTWMELKKSRQ